MAEEIINRVANSALVTIDLEEYHHPGERVILDIADNLYQGLVLREKDFREFVKTNDWSEFRDKNVAITCSADAIVPTWAYMLLTSKLEPYANMVVFGTLDLLEQSLFKQAFSKIDISEFNNAKVVIKGCGDLPIPESAYVEITRILTPVVASIMYGEPCSTVPIYKAPKRNS